MLLSDAQGTLPLEVSHAVPIHKAAVAVISAGVPLDIHAAAIPTVIARVSLLLPDPWEMDVAPGN